MPHLSPMSWMIMLLMLCVVMLLIISSSWWSTPTYINKVKEKGDNMMTVKMNSWKW